MTTIELGDHDAAFILRPGYGLEFLIPEQRDDEVVSDEAMTAAMLAWILSDPIVLREMRARFTEFCRDDDEGDA